MLKLIIASPEEFEIRYFKYADHHAKTRKLFPDGLLSFRKFAYLDYGTDPYKTLGSFSRFVYDKDATLLTLAEAVELGETWQSLPHIILDVANTTDHGIADTVMTPNETAFVEFLESQGITHVFVNGLPSVNYSLHTPGDETYWNGMRAGDAVAIKRLIENDFEVVVQIQAPAYKFLRNLPPDTRTSIERTSDGIVSVDWVNRTGLAEDAAW